MTKNVTCDICHISGKNVTLSHTIFFFNLWRFLSHPSRSYKTFLNGKKCDDSAWTEKCISLPVSDFSHISEAWSGKAIWARSQKLEIVVVFYACFFLRCSWRDVIGFGETSCRLSKWCDRSRAIQMAGENKSRELSGTYERGLGILDDPDVFCSFLIRTLLRRFWL